MICTKLNFNKLRKKKSVILNFICPSCSEGLLSFTTFLYVFFKFLSCLPFHPVWIIISPHLFFPLMCCSLASLPLKEKPQETPNTPLFSKKPNTSFELASYKAPEKLTGRTPRSNNFLGHPQCSWPRVQSNLLLAALRNGFVMMQVPNNFLEPLCGTLGTVWLLISKVHSPQQTPPAHRAAPPALLLLLLSAFYSSPAPL